MGKRKINCGQRLWASMWSCEIFRMKKVVQKSRFRPCFKGIDRMDKKSVDRAYSIPKQARYQLRYTRIWNFLIVVKHVVNADF